MVIIERHGTRLYREGLTVQSALLNSLFETLDTEQSNADMAVLGAEEWLNRLKELQDEFSTLHDQLDELEARKDILGDEEAKADIVKFLSVLISGLDFLFNTNPNKYGETGKSVNAIIEQIIDTTR